MIKSTLLLIALGLFMTTAKADGFPMSGGWDPTTTNTDELVQKLGEFSAQIEALQQEKVQLTGQVSDLTSQLEAQKAASADLDAKLNTCTVAGLESANRITALETENHQLKTENEGLTQHQKDCDARSLELSAQNSDLAKKLEDSNKSITALTESQTTSQNDLKTCQESSATVSASLEECKAQKTKLEEQVVQLTSEKDACAAEKSEIVTKEATLRESYNGLTAEVAIVKNELEDSKTANGELSTKNQELHTQITAANNSLEETKAANDSLTRQVGNLKSEIETLETEHGNLHTKNENLTRRLNEMTAERDENIARLTQCNADKKELNANIEAANQAIADCENRFKTLQGQYDELNRKLVEAMADGANARTLNLRYESKIADLNKEINTFNDKITLLEGEKAAFIQMIDVFEKNALTAESTIKTCNDKTVELDLLLNQMVQANEEIMTHLQELNSQKAQADETISKLTEDLAQANQHVESTQSDLQGKIAQVESLNTELTQIKETEAKLTADNKELADKLAKNEEATKETAGQLEECKANAENLSQSLATAKSDLETANTSASTIQKNLDVCEQRTKELDDRIEVLRTGAVEFPRTIDSLTAEINQLKEENGKLLTGKQELQGLHNEVNGHLAQCREKSVELTDANGKLSQDLSQKQSELELKITEFTQLNEKAASDQANFEKEKATLTSQNDSLSASLKQATERANHLNEDITSLTSENAALKKLTEQNTSDKNLLSEQISRLQNELSVCNNSLISKEMYADLEGKYQICMRDLNNQYSYLFSILEHMSEPNAVNATNSISPVIAAIAQPSQ